MHKMQTQNIKIDKLEMTKGAYLTKIINNKKKYLHYAQNAI